MIEVGGRAGEHHASANSEEGHMVLGNTREHFNMARAACHSPMGRVKFKFPPTFSRTHSNPMALPSHAPHSQLTPRKSPTDPSSLHFHLPSGPTHAVQVLIRPIVPIREVVVHDDIHALNIDTAAKEVCCHQDTLLEVLELLVSSSPVPTAGEQQANREQGGRSLTYCSQTKETSRHKGLATNHLGYQDARGADSIPIGNKDLKLTRDGRE